MPLAVGTKLGPYQILTPIGAGGMGEVYRARDTKLKRDVALKVLPEAFANDPARMARFQREAEVLASLNHPNIAHIYGVEDRALVMELVEGESPKGPMPFEDAWKIAMQIADALEYAHEKGVIHRDLKPANVKVTPDGVVKLLDFGLAKAFSPDETQAGSPDNSPTLTMGATNLGVILGTAAYMAPEQARGKKVDKRADIWSWGVVLYELLTGERMFQGDQVADTLAQVLTKEPDLSRVLPQVRKLLRRCLEKDPKQRLRDLGDALSLVENPTEVPRQAKARTPLAVAAAVLFAAIAAGLGGIAWRATRPVVRPLMQFNAESGREIGPIANGWGSQVVLSPDGRVLVATIRDADGKRRLGKRRLDQNQITPLPGTEDAFAPFFSPDGGWVAFAVAGQLKKISIQGGVPVTICNSCMGGSWGDDNSIVTVAGVRSAIFRVSGDGGTPTPITKLDGHDRAHRWPQMLPGGQAVLFTAYDLGRDYDDSDIDVVSLKTGQRKTVYRGGMYARYLPSGHLVFIHQNTLFAAPFDLKRLTIAGTPQPVIAGIDNGADDGAEFDFSQTGALVYLSSEGALKRSIFWLNSFGQTQPLQPVAGLYSVPRFSPDGKHLAFALDDGQGHTDIWIRDLERATARRLTSLSGRNVNAVWMPDTTGIVFVSSNQAAPGVYWMRSDGSGEPARLTDGASLFNPFAISPDGKWLAALHAAPAPATGGAIWIAPIGGESGHPRLGKPELFLNSAIQPAFSPDGRWIAYFRQLPGQLGVWVQPFRGSGGPWLVDADGGYPVWSRNANELFYVSRSSHRMMIADYSVNGDSFVPDKPRVWSDRLLLPNLVPVTPTYDITPDGKRFAVVLYEDGTAQERPITHVTFLLNFFDELQRRVPEAK